jgi:hypothetical protein
VDGEFVITGNLFEAGNVTISRWGTSSREPEAYEPDQVVDLGDGERLTVAENGAFRLSAPQSFGDSRLPRVFTTATRPPEFTLENYRFVLFDPNNREGMAKAFFNTLTVTIPATVIPIVIAAFAAYALAWMEFPGRALLIAAVVGLLVVPLQLALIPLLKLHNDIGIGKGYLGSGWRIPASACRWRSICSGTTWSACRVTSSRTPGSTAPPISRSSSRSSCRCRFRRWPPSRSSSSSGPGTICWWPLVFLIDATGEDHRHDGRSSNCSAPVAATGKSWPPPPSSRSPCRWWCFFAMQKYLVRGLSGRVGEVKRLS